MEEVTYPLDGNPPASDLYETVQLTVPLIRNGTLTEQCPTLEESREYLAQQLVTLPWEGLALTRDEPALQVRHTA